MSTISNQIVTAKNCPSIYCKFEMKYPRILLVQTSFLGDTILSTPVISSLKTIYPSSEIYMMTTPLSLNLVVRDPLLKGVISYDKRGDESGFFGLLNIRRRIRDINFDIAYSLHRSYRTALLLAMSGIPIRVGFSDADLSFLYTETRKRNLRQHDVIRNLSILSSEAPISSLNTDLRLFPPSKEELSPKIRKKFSENFKYAVLVPGSAWETKMWDYKGFRAVAKHLIDRKISVVLIGAKSDKIIHNKVAEGLDILDLAGETTIDEALYIMKNACLAVCNDSMSLHIASAFKIKTVAVFCATTPSLGFYPWKNNSILIEKKLSCRPCGLHGGRTCPNNTYACIKGISHNTVIDAVERLLNREY
ncbi:MAG: glycosyltransferase family 9 protein [Desulfobacterales bacterium]|nr:glycosyltransferase family 9 protein [Desulfobacterales bacterium]